MQQPIVGALHVLVQPPRRLLQLRLAAGLGTLARLCSKPALRRGVVLQLLPSFRGLQPGVKSALLCSRRWRCSPRKQDGTRGRDRVQGSVEGCRCHPLTYDQRQVTFKRVYNNTLCC